MKLNFFVSKKIQFKNENEIIGTKFTQKKIIICSKILNVNKKFVHINSIEHKFY